MSTARELPLELLAATTPKGSVLHLVNLDAVPSTMTLCGRQTGINPRHLYVGTWRPGVESADNATCRRCRTIALDPTGMLSTH